MRPAPSVAVYVDGVEADLEAIQPFALINDGHFTAMQVRNGATRGIDLHLHRLASAHLRLYRSELDTAWVRDLVRAAVAEHPDSSVRVTVAEHSAGEPHVMVIVRSPVEPDPRPVALQPVPWTRALPDLKHAGTFPQIQLARDVEAEGFDDALLISADGQVSETTIANIAFIRQGEVVWPDGPALRGITQQLLEAALPAHGYSTTRAPVRLADLGRFEVVVLTNSVGVAPVARIGAREFRDPEAAASALEGIYESIPPEPL